MKISIIVAVSANNVIGRNNDLPWRLSSDLKRFKELTTAHVVIMGRKTYESIEARLGGPLPKRINLVLSSSRRDIGSDPIWVPDLDHALQFARIFAEGEEEAFVIGGETLYYETLRLASRIYLTRVETEIRGDAFFPEVDLEEWEVVSREHHEADEKNEYPYCFEVWERKVTA